MNETAAAAQSSNKPIISLVLGILGILCCGFLAPIAWYLGAQEIKAIQAGLSPSSGEGLAKAGMILGIIGSVIFILTLMWLFFAGGMAVFQGALGR